MHSNPYCTSKLAAEGVRVPFRRHLPHTLKHRRQFRANANDFGPKLHATDIPAIEPSAIPALSHDLRKAIALSMCNNSDGVSTPRRGARVCRMDQCIIIAQHTTAGLTPSVSHKPKANLSKQDE